MKRFDPSRQRKTVYAYGLPPGAEGSNRPEIHPLINHRWSPRGIADRPVEPEKLRLCLEAARWAPSSGNQQPWYFLVATRDEPEWLARLQSYLSGGNYWAKKSPILMASAYRTTRLGKDTPNRMALRDLGAAEENMFLQAYACGLAMHQMAGFDAKQLKADLLPEGHEPGAMTAIFYRGEPTDLSEKHQDSERAPRRRDPLSDFVFGAEWGTSHRVVSDLKSGLSGGSA